MRLFTFLLLIVVITTSCTHQAKPLWEDPVIEQIANGFEFTEGPVWVEDLGLIFSDIPQNKVHLYDLNGKVTEYINPSGKSNGLALNADHDLILCQHLLRQVSKYSDGQFEVLASHYNGMKLNSPNDLTIAKDGSIFFTDPTFGLKDDNMVQETPYSGIYRISPDGELFLLDSTLSLPNGIALSPDEKKLYVVECEIADIYVWDVLPDKSIANKTLFYDMNTMWGDGMKVDKDGNIFITAESGIHVFSPEGKLLNTIKVSEKNPTNVNWGSQNEIQSLYVTAGDAVYKVSAR